MQENQLIGSSMAPQEAEKCVEMTYSNFNAESTGGVIQRLASTAIGWKVKKTARKYRSQDWHVFFLPEDEIEKIIRSNMVISTLRRSTAPIQSIDEPNRYKKILAVLYLMGRPSKLRLFVERRIRDTDLPLKLSHEAVDPKKIILSCEGSQSPSTIHFKRSEDAEAFYNYQWSVIPHRFTESNLPIRLEDGRIVPFESYGNSVNKGAYGIIYKARVHPSYHPWHKDKNKVISCPRTVLIRHVNLYPVRNEYAKLPKDLWRLCYQDSEKARQTGVRARSQCAC